MTSTLIREGTDLGPYVPRTVSAWVARDPDRHVRVLQGSLVSADISGFTNLSERLAGLGKEGAEELTALINSCFEGMIAAVSRRGGDVLKFGGDALLVLFTGPDSTAQACAATVEMRACIAQPLVSPTAGRVQLRISQGIHTGAVALFLVEAGGHRELMVTGPGATETVQCEATAEAGQILLSERAAADVDPGWLGNAVGTRRLLRRRSPSVSAVLDLREPVPPDVLERCVPPAQQRQIAAGVDGEHRQVTVAFVKFSDIDRLIERIGADGVSARLNGLAAVIDAASERHGVHWLASDVYPDGGKAILTAGAPTAGRDDDERMLRAVRDIVDADVGLPLRAGVNRGHVFVGALGARDRRTYTVMGDAVNLAARLMQKAEPGQVVASRAVLDRSTAQFETTPLEPFLVKGKSKPIDAALVGALTQQDADARPATVAGPPFVGREQELALLESAMEAAVSGRGRAVEVTGEPGIGKSRLIDELRRRTSPAMYEVVTCGQYARSTPYFAIRPLLRALAGIDAAADRETAGNTLTKWIAAVAPDLEPWLPLLAVPFDAVVDATEEADRIDPSFRRARAHTEILGLLARVMPASGLLHIEDAHWLDDPSRELLGQLAGESANHRWMVCLTRLPGPPALPPETDPLVLDLPPLDGEAAAALATGAADALEDLVPGDVRALTEQAGGNPLFVLELVSAAATAGAAEAGPAGLPDSVEALVTSRIDLLDPADRQLLREASVLGGSVDLELLAGVREDTRLLEPDAWRDLEAFVTVAGGALRFDHGLYRQVAYEGLSFRRRREIHRRVANVLETRAGPQHRREQATILALHFDRAQQHDKAWEYGVLAGDDSRSKYANVEAANFYDRALANAGKAGVPDADVARVAEALGDVAELAGRYTAATDAFSHAHQLLQEDPVADARLAFKRGMVWERKGEYAVALRWFRRGLGAADRVAAPEDANNFVELAMAYAGVRARQGRYAEARRWALQAAGVARQWDVRKGLAHALDLLDVIAMYSSEPDPGHEPGAALPIYEELGDLLGQTSVLNNLGIAAYQAGRWDEAVELYERARRAAEDAGDVVSSAMPMFNIGEIRSDQGRVEEAAEALTEARRIWRGARYAAGVAAVPLYLGRNEVRAGRPEAGLALIDEARQLCEAMHAETFVLESRIRRVECLVALERVDDAIKEGEAIRRSIGDSQANPLLRVALDRVVGRAYALAGRADEGLARLEAALARAEQAEAPFEIAATLMAMDDENGRWRGEGILTELGVVTPPL